MCRELSHAQQGNHMKRIRKMHVIVVQITSYDKETHVKGVRTILSYRILQSDAEHVWIRDKTRVHMPSEAKKHKDNKQHKRKHFSEAWTRVLPHSHKPQDRLSIEPQTTRKTYREGIGTPDKGDKHKAYDS